MLGPCNRMQVEQSSRVGWLEGRGPSNGSFCIIWRLFRLLLTKGCFQKLRSFLSESLRLPPHFGGIAAHFLKRQRFRVELSSSLLRSSNSICGNTTTNYRQCGEPYLTTRMICSFGCEEESIKRTLRMVCKSRCTRTICCTFPDSWLSAQNLNLYKIDPYNTQR